MENINLSFNMAPMAPTAPEVDTALTGLSQSDAANLVSGLFGSSLVEKLKEMITANPEIPQAKQESIGEALDTALESSGIDTSKASSLTPELLKVVMEHLEKYAQETAEEAGKSAEGGGSGASGAGGGGGAKNWLVALARTMGEVAGAHLENMVNLSHQITDLANSTGDDAAQAKQMTALTSEMQAESQMFKMTQEMTTTVVKNIGEALHSTSRKQ